MNKNRYCTTVERSGRPFRLDWMSFYERSEGTNMARLITGKTQETATVMSQQQNLSVYLLLTHVLQSTNASVIFLIHSKLRPD